MFVLGGECPDLLVTQLVQLCVEGVHLIEKVLVRFEVLLDLVVEVVLSGPSFPLLFRKFNLVALPQICLLLLMLLLHVFLHLAVQVLDLLRLLHRLRLGGLLHGLKFRCVSGLLLGELGL